MPGYDFLIMVWKVRKSNGGSVVDLGQNTWFKVYQNKGGDSWNFVAHTVDNNAHQIFALINSPGVYRLQTVRQIYEVQRSTGSYFFMKMLAKRQLPTLELQSLGVLHYR